MNRVLELGKVCWGQQSLKEDRLVKYWSVLKLSCWILCAYFGGVQIGFAAKAVESNGGSTVSTWDPGTSLLEGFGANVGFNTFHYMGREGRATYPSLVGGFSYLPQWKYMDFGVEAEGRVTVNNTSYNYLEFPQLFIGTPRLFNRFQVHVGRKLVDWSRADDEWRLGIIQPRFRWDYVNPKTVGLAGAFASAELGIAKATLFGSPYFTPERGVPFRVSEGAFASDSPWFTSPPRFVRFNNQDTEVVYRVRSPAVSEVISHPGGGGLIELGQSYGFFGSVGYAYKPMNQLNMAYDGKLRIPENQLEVTLVPRVIYHHVFSSSFGFRTETLRTRLSMMGESPENQPAPDGFTYQQVSPAFVASPSIEFDLPLIPRGGLTTFKLGYFKLFGGQVEDVGPRASGNGSIFESRYAFQNAVSVGIHTPLPGPLAKVLLFKSTLFHDFSVQGSMLTSGLEYRPTPFLLMSLGADIIGGKESETGSDFFTRYRTNDRVHGGVSYVF